MHHIALDSGCVLTRDGNEIEYFNNEKDAKAYVLHVYGDRDACKSLSLEIKPIKGRGPKAGDSICYRGGGTSVDYILKAYQDRPARSEIFGVLEGSENLRVCFSASAYRAEGHVSCSGGPVPSVSLDDLTFVGFRRTEFWRFSNGYPKAHTGGYYSLNVPCWLWNGGK